ncbi:LysM domain-containing protein [bacterium]|nr:LysM domain-containing protein [bacterium]
MFPVTSRYHNLETAKKMTADGREIIYLRRRFLPGAAELIAALEHAVTQGERLDNITARYLGDPEQFWRLCDANNAMHPEELAVEIGRRLKISLPQ